MPIRIASEVPVSTSALPPTSSSGCSACGRIAYLIGPNSVECRPIRNSTLSISAQAVRVERDRGERHRGDLEQLHEADDACLLEFLRELAGARRKQEERQDEQRRRDVRVEADRALVEAQVEADQHDQRVAERVVVERAERLGREERREAPQAQQLELVVSRHGALRGRTAAIYQSAAQPAATLASADRRELAAPAGRRGPTWAAPSG